MTLTYRANRTGTLLAAYARTCRIGYVERTRFDRWRWQLILLRPEGGAYLGVEDDQQAAQDRLLANWVHWLASAGLRPATKETT